jgi:hypothetical protein
VEGLTDTRNCDECLSALARTGSNYKTVAYVAMIIMLPHIEGMSVLSSDISLSNPLQAILYHYIILNIFVYAAEKNYFTFAGLSNEAPEVAGDSECKKVRARTESNLAVLAAQCEERRIPIPDFDSYFFQYREIPLILKADRLRARREQDDVLSDNESGDRLRVNESEDEETEKAST